MNFRRTLATIGLAVVVGTVAVVPSAHAAVDPATDGKTTGGELFRGDPEGCSTVGKIVTGGGILCDLFDPLKDSVLGIKHAPAPESPNEGVGDNFGALAPQNAPDGSPFADQGPTMLASSGLAGFLADNFDLTGSKDVIGSTAAVVDTTAANTWTRIGLTITGGTALIERYAFNPTDLMAFLSQFSEAATEVLRVKIWLPWTAVGLLAATLVLLLNHAIRGQIRSVLWGVAWATIVLGIGGIAATEAIPAATYGIRGVTSISGGLSEQFASGSQSGNVINDNLNGGGFDPSRMTNPNAASDAATEAILRNIHYKSFCVQTLGSSTSKTAVQFCPGLWEAQRYSYFEQAQIDRDPTRREDIAKTKNDKYTELADEVKKVDPKAYQSMQGIESGRETDAALYTAFSIVCNVFRFFAAVLIMMAAVTFVGYCLAWLVASPVLVIGGWGEDLGKSLLSGAFKGFVYAIAAVAGSWGFTIWTQIALTQSTPFAVFLLVVGFLLFWGLLRPDRKIMSLASFGRVKGASKSMKWLLDKGLGMLGASWAASGAAEKVVESVVTPEDRTENYRRPPAPPVYVETVPAIGNVHEGVVLDKTTDVVPAAGNTDVHTPRVVADEEPRQEQSAPVPNMDDWDSSEEVSLYTPEYLDKDGNVL